MEAVVVCYTLLCGVGIAFYCFSAAHAIALGETVASPSSHRKWLVGGVLALGVTVVFLVLAVLYMPAV